MPMELNLFLVEISAKQSQSTIDSDVIKHANDIHENLIKEEK